MAAENASTAPSVILAITGASGTPPMSSDATTGITLHEQKGLNAPTIVARTMATSGCALRARVM